MSPALPTKVVKTAVPEPFAACMAHGADSPLGLWCIGHIAPTPWPHVHSAACGSAAVIHSATGTSAKVPTWHNNQTAVTGTRTRRICVIKETLFPES
jgi:hypothetical protein